MEERALMQSSISRLMGVPVSFDISLNLEASLCAIVKVILSRFIPGGLGIHIF